MCLYETIFKSSMSLAVISRSYCTNFTLFVIQSKRLNSDVLFGKLCDITSFNYSINYFNYSVHQVTLLTPIAAKLQMSLNFIFKMIRLKFRYFDVTPKRLDLKPQSLAYV